jgi:hypothetical protein
MTQNFARRTITCNNFPNGMKREVISQMNIAFIILMTFHKAYKRSYEAMSLRIILACQSYNHAH